MTDDSVATWSPKNNLTQQQVSATHAAIKHIKKEIDRRGGGMGIHFGVKKTGCSGLAYVVDIIDDAKDYEHTFKLIDDLVIAVDTKSFMYVKGTQIDYVREGLNNHFKFSNPNEASSCGCGESFNVTD